jgi:3',5'-cyclic AMP phosphodiesterase CpdA
VPRPVGTRPIPRLTLIVWLAALAAGLYVCVPWGASQTTPPTPPAPPPERHFVFGVFGDSRPTSAHGEQPRVFRQITYELGQIKPDFVVGLGDLIYATDDEASVQRQWQGFFYAMGPLQAKGTVSFVPVPGNHDIVGSKRNQEIFQEHLKHLYYSFDHQGCHFVSLDSEVVGQAGRITGEQLAWLKRDLAANKSAVLTFVFVHRPLFPVNGHVGSSLDEDKTNRDTLHQLFVDMGVDCVFAGHEHLFNHSTHDGLTYIISGGAGAPLYAPADRGGFYHYLLVTVHGTAYSIEVRQPLQTP